MKKNFRWWLILMSVFAAVLPVVANDFVVSVDKIYYICKDDGTAVVRGIDNNKYLGLSYKDTVTSMVIPDMVYTDRGRGAYKVKKVDAVAFMDCPNLESVILPAGVEEIGRSAFENCKKLNFLQLPEGLLKVEDEVFEGCESLAILRLPDTVETLGKNVFSGMSSLQSIVLPPGLLSIGTTPFYDCPKLKKVALPSPLADRHRILAKTGSDMAELVSYREDDYRCEDGIVYSQDYSTLYFAPVDFGGDRKVEINRPVKTIGINAFYCSDIEEVILPEGLVTIGVGAFSFSGLAGMLNIPEGVEVLGAEAYLGCWKLTGVTFPETLREIGDECFTNSGALVTRLPMSLESVGHDALRFAATDVLVIPPSVKRWEAGVGNPKKLVGNARIVGGYKNIPAVVAYPDEVMVEDGFIYSPDYTLLYYAPYEFEGVCTVRESVRELGPNSFAYSKVLTGVELPSTLETIRAQAFYGCPVLESVDIPDSVEIMEESAFAFCESLALVRLPEKMKSIYDETFYNCKSLKTIKIPDSVWRVGVSAFYGSGLESIEFGKSLQIIYRGAFENCVGLKQVLFPESVTEIRAGAFMGCTGLKCVLLPKNLKVLHDDVFDGCTGLKKCAYPSTVQNPFSNAWRTIAYQPEGAVIENGFVYSENYAHLYFAPTLYSGSYEIADGCMTIGDNAFYDCRYLTSVKMPETIKNIGTSSFEDCENLVEVNIPDGVTKIEAEAFIYCRSLGDIILPESLVEIGDYGFGGANMSRIILPGSLKKIGLRALSIDGKNGVLEIYYNTNDPREFNNGIFGGTHVYDYATLYVAPGGLEKARETIPWKYFLTIREKEFTGVNGVVDDASGEIDFNSSFEVYDMGGILVSTSVEGLPAGLYVIRQHGKTQKIIIR